MGTLTLPDEGVVYLDANGLIYSVERIEPYRALLNPMWQAAQEGQVTVVSSGLTVVESLVKPLRDGNEEIEAQYREVFEASVFGILDMPLAVFELAAQIRANAQLKMADALHAATALHAGCDLFVTNDTDFRRVPALPTVVLDDLLDDETRG